ncbi:MAG: hypothetical protein CMM01_00935 [Rhodopirellula sp.]|nr:hypothetical protein [Rhodopirellula sp.]OUX52587.1 MAG: hypothetical protein CBE43_00300 [Rhodopirellula sp. TMED283]
MSRSTTHSRYSRVNRHPPDRDPGQPESGTPPQLAGSPSEPSDARPTDKTRGIDEPTLEIPVNQDDSDAEYSPDSAAPPVPGLSKETASNQGGDSATPIPDATIAQEQTEHGKRSTHAGVHETPAHLGRYQIEDLLGRGGMGSVYRAHDTQLDRKVALKVPKFEANTNSRLIDRFYREARSAANLAHPNLCPVFDVGEFDGIHYIAMALIKGDTLSSHIRNNAELPERFAAMTVLKIARAMQEAHGSGIIHRDIKPANIMIDHRKEPILMDFGLACPEELGDDSRLTQEGALLGSPAYMSPEQLRGDKDAIGQGSDVYALGVVLYEILSGRLPFAGNGSTISMIGQILTEDPTELRSLRPTISTALAQICDKAMAKNSAERYASMESLANALERSIRSHASRKNSPNGDTKTVQANITQIQLNEQSKLVKTLCESKQFAAAVPILQQMLDNPQAKNSKTHQWASATLSKVQTRIEENQRKQDSANSTTQVAATTDTNNDLFADLPAPTSTSGHQRSTLNSSPLKSAVTNSASRKNTNKSAGTHSRHLILSVAGLALMSILLIAGLWYWAQQPAATPSTNSSDIVGGIKQQNFDPQPMPVMGERQRLPDRIMQYFDRDRDGFIAMTEMPRAGKSILMRADTNDDGRVSRNEVQNTNPKLLLQLLTSRPDLKNLNRDQRPLGGPNGFENRRTEFGGPGFAAPEGSGFDSSKPRGGAGPNRPSNGEGRAGQNLKDDPTSGQGARPAGGPPFGRQRSNN